MDVSSLNAKRLLSLLGSSAGRPTISELEKHLNDYSHGVAYNSKKTANQLSDLDISNGLSLSPKDQSAYLRYQTAFTYNAKARFASSVNQSIETVSIIKEANSDSSVAQKNKEEILKAYQAQSK